jgi:hypothetical protein
MRSSAVTTDWGSRCCSAVAESHGEGHMLQCCTMFALVFIVAAMRGIFWAIVIDRLLTLRGVCVELPFATRGFEFSRALTAGLAPDQMLPH